MLVEPTTIRGMLVDDVLDGLELKDRTILVEALTKRNPLNPREFLVSTPTIVRECADDGFVVTEWSVASWRRKHADR